LVSAAGIWIHHCVPRRTRGKANKVTHAQRPGCKHGDCQPVVEGGRTSASGIHPLRRIYQAETEIEQL
jgi:hypothetical protein